MNDHVDIERENGGRDESSARPFGHWKRRAYITWTVIGVCVLFMGAVAVAGVIWQAAAVVLVAGLMTFLFHGAVDFLERKKVPRVVGASACMLGVVGFALLVFMLFVPNMISETRNFAVNAPSYASQAQAFVDEAAANGAWGVPAEQLALAIDAASEWLSDQAAGILSGMASGILGGVIDTATGLAILFISMICSFWLLIDWPKIAVEVRKIVPENHHDDIDILKEAFGTAVYGWLKSTTICALMTGAASFIVFSILGMPYAVVLALFCAVMYVIPYIGIMVAVLVAGVVGILVSPGTALASAALIAIVMNVIANIVAPRLMGSSLSIHPAVILVVIMIGGALCGIWGMLFSIPLAAALQAVFVTYFEARTGKELASEDGALFRDTSRLSSAESLVLDD